MRRVFPTKGAVFLVVDPIGMSALILGAGVIAALALAAGEDDFVSRHTT